MTFSFYYDIIFIRGISSESYKDISEQIIQ